MGVVPKKGYCGEPVVTYRKPKTSSAIIKTNPIESDEFNSFQLGKQWQWQANYDQKFGMPTTWGVYRLYTYKAGSPDNLTPPKSIDTTDLRIWNVPNLLLQKHLQIVLLLQQNFNLPPKQTINMEECS